jgi:hypothetical protein
MKPEGGRFDEDTYARARKFVESAGGEEPKKTFKQAFAEARKAGDSTFTWNGKKYTTELASDKAKSAPKADENYSKEGRGKKPSAAPAAKAPEPAKVQSDAYPTAAERFSQIRQQLADAEKENARKTSARNLAGRKSYDDFMAGVKRRFGTQAMREEAGNEFRKGGKVKKYAKGGSVKGGGCEVRGKTKKGVMR